jgi:hypothetical protein
MAGDIIWPGVSIWGMKSKRRHRQRTTYLDFTIKELSKCLELRMKLLVLDILEEA